MTSATVTTATASGDEGEALREVERRVLWLSTAIIRLTRTAGTVRIRSGIKVGGHQASSASLVTIMTALWFEHLPPG